MTVLYKDGLQGRDRAKGLSGELWYEDYLGPETLEARADGMVWPMLYPVFSAGQWAFTGTVQ